jgi:hypothetical protein
MSCLPTGTCETLTPPSLLLPPAADLGLTALQGLHTECDVHGTRLLQRYADYRRLARIAGQIGMRKRDDTTAEAAPVEPRQARRCCRPAACPVLQRCLQGTAVQ